MSTRTLYVKKSEVHQPHLCLFESALNLMSGLSVTLDNLARVEEKNTAKLISFASIKVAKLANWASRFYHFYLKQCQFFCTNLR